MRLSAAALTTLLLLAARPGLAGDDAGGKTGLELLSAAVKATTIDGEGSPPFHLAAEVTVHGEFRGRSEGRLELDWLSPGRYRLELTMPDARFVRVADGEMAWTLRSPECPPHRMDWPVALLRAALDGDLVRGDEPGRLKKRDGGRLTCVMISEADLDRRVECVDAKTGLPALTELGTTRDRLEYANHAPWGPATFPRTLRLFVKGWKAVGMTLTLAAPQGDVALSPPDGAKPWPRGPEYEGPVLSRWSLSYPPMAARQQLTGLVTISGTIGADGLPTDLAIACPSGFKALDEVTLAAIRRWSWLPALANGQPVPAELREVIDYRVFIGAAPID